MLSQSSHLSTRLLHKPGFFFLFIFFFKALIAAEKMSTDPERAWPALPLCHSAQHRHSQGAWHKGDPSATLLQPAPAACTAPASRTAQAQKATKKSNWEKKIGDELMPDNRLFKAAELPSAGRAQGLFLTLFWACSVTDSANVSSSSVFLLCFLWSALGFTGE